MNEIVWVISERSGTIIKKRVTYDIALETKQQCEDRQIPVVILKEINHESTENI